MMPPTQSRPSWPSQDDNTGFYLVVTLLGIAALAYLLWHNDHAAVSRIVVQLHEAEICVIQIFSGRFDQAAREMADADYDTITLRDLYRIAHDIGSVFRVPALVLILCLAAICALRAAPARFRRSFDVDGLLDEQARSFPSGSVFARRHLRLVAPEKELRPLDYALTAQEWVARFAVKDTGFDEELCRSALLRQLGPRWRGVTYAGPHVQALVAVFALHLAVRREAALRLLATLAEAMADPGEDKASGPATALTLPATVSNEVRRVLADGSVSAPALDIMEKHAFVSTALMTLLNEARRRTGVLAPAQFSWLRLVDRDLWYALHSLGFEAEGGERYVHPNPRAEAAAARDHWAAERIVGRAVVEPSVDRAVAALRKAGVTAPASALRPLPPLPAVPPPSTLLGG